MTRDERLWQIIEFYGEGRLDDMGLETGNPERYMLVQQGRDGEPWYVLAPTLDKLVHYIETEDDGEWYNVVVVDLDTGTRHDVQIKVEIK